MVNRYPLMMLTVMPFKKVGEVEQSMHAISAKLYEAAAAEMDDQSEEPAGSDDVVDADFEVVRRRLRKITSCLNGFPYCN